MLNCGIIPPEMVKYLFHSILIIQLGQGWLKYIRLYKYIPATRLVCALLCKGEKK